MLSYCWREGSIYGDNNDNENEENNTNGHTWQRDSFGALLADAARPIKLLVTFSLIADDTLESWKVAMAVVIPVVVIILIAIVAVIAYMKYGRKNNKKGSYNAAAYVHLCQPR